MICKFCKQEVAVVNDTTEGEACINCKEKYELQSERYNMTTFTKKLSGNKTVASARRYFVGLKNV